MVSHKRYGQKVKRHRQTQVSKQGRGKLAGRGTGWQKEGERGQGRERRAIELNWECPKGKLIRLNLERAEEEIPAYWATF